METIRIDYSKIREDRGYIMKLIQKSIPILKIRINHWNKNVRIVET